MSTALTRLARAAARHPEWLPFADAVSAQLPLGRLARLGLFQISVGMAMALLLGTVNRVMIVELQVPSSIVASMLALPLLVAPFRALFGFRSDHHRSILGWRRVPFIWSGTILQFCGLCFLPFALLLLSQRPDMPLAVTYGVTALAYLLVGCGAYLTQTAGLALATDLATAETRPRVVALLYVLLLLGTLLWAVLFGWLLQGFSTLRLIQVVQSCALVTLALNLTALWKQEARTPHTRAELAALPPPPSFRSQWQAFLRAGRAGRLLVAVGLGSFAFNLQDVLLEPYGGEILGLSVASTTVLTAIMAGGGLAAMGLAARWLARGHDPNRVASVGLLVGIVGFLGVIFAAPLAAPALFYAGTALIGAGEGFFAVGTLAWAMELPAGTAHAGIVLGGWGAVFATAEGLALFASGAGKDLLSHLTGRGALGTALQTPAAPYSIVYHTEILALFLALVALGPLVAPRGARRAVSRSGIGLAELPG